MGFGARIVAGMVLGAGSVALAAPIAYEGFGTVLDPISWSNQRATLGSFTRDTNDLPGPLQVLTSTAGRAKLTWSINGSKVQNRLNTTGHDDLTVVSGSKRLFGTQPMWLSWLMNPGFSGECAMRLQDGNTAPFASFGFASGSDNTFKVKVLSEEALLSAPPSRLATHFYVLRLDYPTSITLRARLYIDPTSMDQIDNGWVLEREVGWFGFDTIAMFANPSTSDAAYFDEVRLATTLEEVAAVPEPAVLLAASGLAVAALSLRQRRRVR